MTGLPLNFFMIGCRPKGKVGRATCYLLAWLQARHFRAVGDGHSAAIEPDVGRYGYFSNRAGTASSEPVHSRLGYFQHQLAEVLAIEKFQ